MKVIGFVFVVFLLVFMISSASAQNFDGREIARELVDNIEESFGPIFGALLGTGAFDDFLFAKVLVLFLLILLIFSVLSRVEFFKGSKNKAIPLVISIIVSILAVRFISEDGFFAGILLPYGALGISVATFAPLLIYFWLLHFSVRSGFGRRVAWILYGVAFTVLWISRIGSISTSLSWIYALTLMVLVISLVFDKTLHGYFRINEIGKFKRSAKERTIVALQREYLDIVHVDTRDAERRRSAIESQLRRLGSDIP